MVIFARFTSGVIKVAVGNGRYRNAAAPPPIARWLLFIFAFRARAAVVVYLRIGAALAITVVEI